MTEPTTCGQGLAHNADVPARLAATAAELARNLELHVGALGHDDAAAQERAVYERVARRLRSAAADLRAAADEMAAARDLPMGAHDLRVLISADGLDAFEHYVAAGDDLRTLLEARREDDAQMLAAIRAAVGAS
jgi:hypothetical protein